MQHVCLHPLPLEFQWSHQISLFYTLLWCFLWKKFLFYGYCRRSFHFTLLLWSTVEFRNLKFEFPTFSKFIWYYPFSVDSFYFKLLWNRVNWVNWSRITYVFQDPCIQSTLKYYFCCWYGLYVLLVCDPLHFFHGGLFFTKISTKYPLIFKQNSNPSKDRSPLFSF